MNAIANAPVYDVRTVEKLLGFQYSVAEFDSIGKQPDALPGVVTFFDPGWSILVLRKVVAAKGTIFYPQGWYDVEPFASLEEQPRYRQLRTNEVTDSFSKTFAEQKTLLPADDEVPFARVVVMGMVIHFLATGGERLFPKYFVRCIDRTSEDGRVYMGYFDFEGFLFGNYSDDDSSPNVGLASSRKF